VNNNIVAVGVNYSFDYVDTIFLVLFTAVRHGVCHEKCIVFHKTPQTQNATAPLQRFLGGL